MNLPIVPVSTPRLVRRAALAIALLTLASPLPLLAWWDTQIRAQDPVPLVQEFPAAKCQGATEVRDDPQADGGKGGKVAWVKPGSELTFQKDLPRGFYAVWIIARADEKDDRPPTQVKRKLPLTGGEAELDDPCQTVFATLKIKRPDGQVEQWAMPIIFETRHAVVSKLYFPLHVQGKCEISVGLDARSEIGLLVDRVELRDVLGNCARKAAKTGRTLKSDEELAALRKATAEAMSAKAAGKNTKPPVILSSEERKARNASLWSSLPALNLMHADPAFKKWNMMSRPDKADIVNAAAAYEKTADKDRAWDSAILLCAYAEKFPGIDFAYQSTYPSSNFSARKLSWGAQDGKFRYSGHAPQDHELIATAYDQIFDFIKDNQELADFVGARIPWVKKPQDVIELLDTNLLQHGIDCLNRRVMRSDELAALLPLIQGPNDVSRKMLEGGLFKKVHYNMVDAGSIEDQVFSAFNRGGVHYIGAAGYVTDDLTKITEILHKYCLLGGDRRFDLGQGETCPQLKEGRLTKEGLSAAGGFPIIVGDSMDMRRRREARFPEYPSRVLEGFGEVVLEDGQGATNPLLKRAVAIHTGIGRGHSHQDTLNLEMFAHGCRLAPDLGGRHEGPLHSSPNMRVTRMHNTVEVDLKNFANLIPGSTTSGTGWTTSFSPQPGAQYTANSARATSNPEVTLYQRSTAMIDGAVNDPRADMYLFDVFRVQGGKVHTYCFHGAPDVFPDKNRPDAPAASKLKANFELKPAGAEAKLYMNGRPPETMQEGVAPAALEATWPLGKDCQKFYQEASYQESAPVGLALTLFGHEGEKVMVGGATSKAYPVDMPYLHLQGQQAQGERVSIYPALYEAFAGAPFLSEKKLLKIKPESRDAGAGVAVAVKVGEKRRDVLFSSLQPEKPCELEDGTQVAAEFGFLSEDADGLRMLHLVGGTRLARGGVSVRCDRAAWEARIETVDYPKLSMTLSADLPPKLLDGQLGLFGNDLHLAEFQLATVGGRRASVVRTPKYYQSDIEAIDEAKGQVLTELEPSVYGCDPLFCNGTTVGNDRGDKTWKATLNPSERWMYLGWPGCRLSYPAEVTEADLKDANGDGKRVLKLMGNGTKEKAEGKPAEMKEAKPAEEKPAEKGNDKDEEKVVVAPERRLEGKDQVMLEMEITRTVPEKHLFYFKMPENPDYQNGGWQFANRIMVNEDGSKKWWGGYPGTAYTWTLQGNEKPSKATLSPDGQGHLNAYHFGPGDSMKVKTFVWMKRKEPGLFELRANVPCTVSLPGAGSFETSSDGKEFKPHASQKTGASSEISLTAAELGNGILWLRRK